MVLNNFIVLLNHHNNLRAFLPVSTHFPSPRTSSPHSSNTNLLYFSINLPHLNISYKVELTKIIAASSQWWHIQSVPMDMQMHIPIYLQTKGSTPKYWSWLPSISYTYLYFPTFYTDNVLVLYQKWVFFLILEVSRTFKYYWWCYEMMIKGTHDLYFYEVISIRVRLKCVYLFLYSTLVALPFGLYFPNPLS